MPRFHVHWHKYAGMHRGIFLPFWECRCGSRRFATGWFL